MTRYAMTTDPLFPHLPSYREITRQRRTAEMDARSAFEPIPYDVDLAESLREAASKATVLMRDHRPTVSQRMTALRANCKYQKRWPWESTVFNRRQGHLLLNAIPLLQARGELETAHEFLFLTKQHIDALNRLEMLYTRRTGDLDGSNELFLKYLSRGLPQPLLESSLKHNDRQTLSLLNEYQWSVTSVDEAHRIVSSKALKNFPDLAATIFQRMYDSVGDITWQENIRKGRGDIRQSLFSGHMEFRSYAAQQALEATLEQTGDRDYIESLRRR